MEINRRIKGIETLIAGSIAPDILITDKEGDNFKLSNYDPAKNYTLLTFLVGGV